MACVNYGTAIVCLPDNSNLRRRILRCPTCQCRTEMVVRAQSWFPVETMCTRCGDSWSDGDIDQRPFERGWRTRAVQAYRRMWAVATYGPLPRPGIDPEEH
jgi:hypothetical protein